jgi:hypothetical protein
MKKLKFSMAGALLAAGIILPVQTLATPITVTNTYQLLDNVTPNANGITSGLRQQFGSTCVVLTGNPCTPQNPVNAQGTSGTATQGATTFALNYVASDLASNHWSRAPAAASVPDGAWTLNFSNGANTATAQTPTLTGAAPIGFVNAASLAASGSTMTFNWSLPSVTGGASIDAVSVNIRDMSDFRGTNGVGGNGVATLIYRNQTLGASATSFSIAPNDPRFLTDPFTGQQFSLLPGQPYSLEIQVQDTRNNTTNGAFTNVLSQSRTFVYFSLPGANMPPQYYLPTIDATGSIPIFGFSGIPIVAGRTIYIDPVVATGFDYQIAAGTPNIRSVTLPTGIGDNLFDLWLWDGTAWVDSSIDILGGQEFLFAAGGLDRFRITGIETAAFVDPFSPTAFVTGLSFVADGTFTGTMTPLVLEIAQVPEPPVIALMLFAFGLLGVTRKSWSARRER